MVAVLVGAAQRGRYINPNNTEQHIEIRSDNKSNRLTAVQKDTLVCTPVRIGQYGKGGQGAKTWLYKIDDYVIRKLTPIEAERLQTLPDNYTAGISNTQRYKCIGNDRTIDVIAHILGEMHGRS